MDKRADLRLALVATPLIFSSAPCRAEDGFVDQVERLEMEKGEFELENQFILARRNGEHSFKANSTAEYGISDRFQIGLELESEKEAGEAFSPEELAFQFKWIAIDPEEALIGFGLQSALVLATHGGAVGSETFLIAEARPAPFELTANLVLETEPGEWDELDTSYAIRADREFGEDWALGIEAGGALGGEGNGSHFIGPVILFVPAEDWPVIELSAFAPLSNEAPALQLRLELDWEF